MRSIYRSRLSGEEAAFLKQKEPSLIFGETPVDIYCLYFSHKDLTDEEARQQLLQADFFFHLQKLLLLSESPQDRKTHEQRERLLIPILIKGRNEL